MAQQEKPFIPPPRKPVQEFFTPTPTAVFYTELVNRDDPAYQAVTPITRGSLYSSISGGNQSVTDKYPNLYFLRESRLGTSDQLVLWTWANDPVAESSYNSEVSYFLEDASTPTFTRVYTVRRDVYDNSTPTARGTALSAIIGVKITAAGEDYTFATGTVGNATVVFVCGNGQILSGIVTNEGSGITNNATIVIHGDGANGAAEAIVQPTDATLMSEGKKEFPENHPLRNEYVQVTRVYRTLPGPITYDNLYDNNKGPVRVASQEVAKAGGEASSESFTAPTKTKTEYEQTRDNSNILIKKTETSTLPASALSEQEYDQQWDVVIPSVRQRVPAISAGIGTNRVNIKAIDSVESETVTFDPAVLNAVFGTYLNYFDNTTNLQLPDVLTSLSALENKANGSGAYNEQSTGLGSGTDFFMSMSAHGRTSASASVMFDVAIEYKQYWARNVPMTSYFFFLQSPVTSAQILAKLQTLTGLAIGAWPKFIPQGHTIIALGQKINVGATAKTGFQQSSSSSGSSVSGTAGQGSDIDTSVSRHSIRIPPMIHNTISVTGLVNDVVPVSCTAIASDPVVTITASSPGGTSAIGSLSPTAFAATTPSSIVTSGLLLLRSDVSPYRFGWARVSADVVNMTNVA